MGAGDPTEAAAYDEDKLDFLPVAADFEYEVEDEGSAPLPPSPPAGGSPTLEPATASCQQQQQDESKIKTNRPTDPRKHRAQQLEESGLASRPSNDADRYSSRRSSKNWSPDRPHSEASHRKRNRSRSRSPRSRDPRGDPRRSKQESSKSRTWRHEENQPKRSRSDERSHNRESRSENGGQQQVKPEHYGANLQSQAPAAPVQALPVQPPVQEAEEPFGDIYESSPAKVDAAMETTLRSSNYTVQNGTDKRLQQDDAIHMLDPYVSELDPVPEASFQPLVSASKAADNRSSPKHASEDEAEPESNQLTTKDKKALMLLRVAVADYVKEALKPTWKEGHMSKDVYKTIVKKAVDKVLSTLKSHQIPRSQEKVDHFMTFSRQKISKLVQGYVEKYQKKSS